MLFLSHLQTQQVMSSHIEYLIQTYFSCPLRTREASRSLDELAPFAASFRQIDRKLIKFIGVIKV